VDRDERILGRCASSIEKWRLLVRGDSVELEKWASKLERSLSPPRLPCVVQWQSSLGNLEPAANRVSSCRVDEMLYDASAVCSAPRVGVPVLDLAVPREAPDALTVNLVSQE
jgi:hypothetical protein